MQSRRILFALASFLFAANAFACPEGGMIILKDENEVEIGRIDRYQGKVSVQPGYEFYFAYGYRYNNRTICICSDESTTRSIPKCSELEKDENGAIQIPVFGRWNYAHLQVILRTPSDVRTYFDILPANLDEDQPEVRSGCGDVVIGEVEKYLPGEDS